MKRPRYTDVGLNHMDIGNLPAVRKWFMANGNMEVSFDRVQTLSSDNRVEFSRIYGTRHQTFTSEFRFDVWRIQHEGLYFWILSAKSKGTTYEVENPTIWDSDGEYKVISFLENLFSELKELEAEV
jgi:hypothetical protein